VRPVSNSWAHGYEQVRGRWNDVGINFGCKTFYSIFDCIDIFQIIKKIRSKPGVNEEDPLIRVSVEAKGIRFAGGALIGEKF